MTPLWVPLVVAAVGLVGVLLTQYLSNKRAKDDRADAGVREHNRVTAEAEQRRLDWQREQRRDAHSEFLTEQWKAEHKMTMWNQVGGDEPPAPDWTEPMARRLQVVKMFGTTASAKAAESLFSITVEMNSPAWGVGRYMVLDEAKDAYLAAVKADLGDTAA